MKNDNKSDILIDFVILWVDGSDPEWLKEKSKYKTNAVKANTANRFRDWDNFHYWFRAVEKFAPWVNKIHIVTCGQVPKFLNLNNPKIHMVNHKDIIDEKYLPTFNSRAIEMNIFKIKDLSEHFVYFNDDLYLTNYVKPEDFFVNGIPVDEFAENTIEPAMDSFAHTMFNNVSVITKYFDKATTKKRLKGKYYNIKYGTYNIKTLLLTPYKHFVGFQTHHLAQPYLKSYFEKVYNLEKELIDKTTSCRFRDNSNINQYLVRYFQLLDGNFVPRKHSFGKMFVASDDNSSTIKSIRSNKYKCICINDNDTNFDFEKAKKEINSAFEAILPEKSSFEK